MKDCTMLIHRSKKVTGVRGVILLAAVLVTVWGQAPCFADGFASSLCSSGTVRTLESIFGPIFPCGGIGTTFRSELGTGLLTASAENATLTGPDGVVRDLRGVSFLDKYPVLFNYYANLRLWRFGLRGTFTNFEDVSGKIRFAKADFTGFSLRGQFDAIQTCWCSAGLMATGYFTEPQFQGLVVQFDPNTGAYRLPDERDIKGDRPITYGVYLRYVPPEIFNFPMHFEAFGALPLKGSTKLKSFGVAFVFRPQIYRFDLAARLIFDKAYMKFENTNVQLFNNIPEKWQVDMNWNFYGAEVAAYF
jgi:hypothetical protein